MNDVHLVLHGLAIKKHASAAELTGLTGLSRPRIEALLSAAEAGGRLARAKGKYLLSPLARVALEADYSRAFAAQRQDAAFIAAYDRFEHINVQLKALITDWQTIEIAGRRLANDHRDKAHDSRIIDRLGEFHERAATVLAQLIAGVPRLTHYDRALLAALERAEGGDIEWVSDVRIESYHTLWFELHEDLLRIVGQTRSE
ncbi:MAG: hypothetical protein ACT4QA_09060 [Panacagrimonas sp.]